MTQTMRAGLVVCIFAIAGAVFLQAQGRGSPEWTTSRYDAQRTA